jgi:hypothetical protein
MHATEKKEQTIISIAQLPNAVHIAMKDKPQDTFCTRDATAMQIRKKHSWYTLFLSMFAKPIYQSKLH